MNTTTTVQKGVHMKKTVLLALASLAFASPALAAETGPRIGVTAGIAGDDIFDTDEEVFGVEAGYDFALGGAVAGIEASYDDLLEGGDDSVIAIGGRLGAPVGKTLIYGGAAYANADGDGGYRLSGGVEFGVGKGLLAKVEQRYIDLGHGGDGFSTVVGVGFRF